jgi:nitroreductase
MHTHSISSQDLSQLLRERRSIRDFSNQPIPADVLDAIIGDASLSPSWSNTQPYRLAIASGAVRDRLANSLTHHFERASAAQRGSWLGKLRLLATKGGMPDGDFEVNFEYPKSLQAQRRATGHGLYQLLNIGRSDHAARHAQMRRNFEFFGAPTAIFIFVHGDLREFSVLDAGIFLQSLMLSAQARGLGTCAQGALASWGSPVRAEFDVPEHYKLIAGVSIGYPSNHVINDYNPGRLSPSDLLLPTALKAS